jgi:hypothetical protein
MANAVWTRGLAGVALIVALGSATPVLALEDGKGSPLDALMGMLGAGPEKDDVAIQYRDRPPLVVPPKTELRAPLPPPAARTAAWPQEQEAIRARKKAEDRHRYVPENVSAAELARTGRINPRDQKERPGAVQCDMDPFNKSGCSQSEYWGRLRDEKIGDTGPKKTGELQAGIEPPREYLTQPPKGYMAPKQSTKATWEPMHKEEEDIRDFFRKKPTSDDE